MLIRRHLYPQTTYRRPPFVLSYGVVGEIDQLGDGVRGFQLGDRVADMTVVGSNAAYRTLRARDLVRVPKSVDAAEAAALILSWTTAYQLLHRAARVQRGQRVLVQGPPAQSARRCSCSADWRDSSCGAPRAASMGRSSASSAPHRSTTNATTSRVLPAGATSSSTALARTAIAAHSRRSSAAACSAPMATRRACRRNVMLTMLMWIARLYLWSWLPGGKRALPRSMDAGATSFGRTRLGLLATRAIRPRVAERISFEEVAEAHRRLEAGGLEGKLVLCPDESGPSTVQAAPRTPRSARSLRRPLLRPACPAGARALDAPGELGLVMIFLSSTAST